MTVKTVLALVEEWKKLHDEGAVNTPRYKEVCALIWSDEAKVFKCAECGKAHSWFDLATWYCVPEKNYFVCCDCYDNKVMPRIQRQVAKLSLKANRKKQVIPEEVWKSLWQPHP